MQLLCCNTFLFTEGSALPNGPDGWGVNIIYPDRIETKGFLGPELTSATSPNWVGAFAATSCEGELSGMYHALDWINTRRTSPSIVVPPNIKLSLCQTVSHPVY